MDGSETAGAPPRGETQAEADARIKAAFDAYTDGRTVPGEAGRPDKPKPIEEITPLWEAMWATADFSWAGLANAGWDRADEANSAQHLKRWRAPIAFPGGGAVVGEGETAYKQATLQDYWRFIFWSAAGGEASGPWDPAAIDDAMATRGLLQTRPDGRIFHALHCSDVQLSVALDTDASRTDLQSDAASISAKGTGGAEAALARLLIFALKAASAYTSDEAPDGRVQLAGARAGGIDAAWRAFAEGGPDRRLHISASLSDLTDLNASRLTFGDGANFFQATLGEGANFSGASLGDGATFFRATFGEGATFSGATLGEDADFSGATLGEDADFSAATLGEGANFFQATLGEGATFSRATLGEGVNFFRATLGDRANFFRATLGDGATFFQATLGDRANFFGATLGDGANFFRATLGKGADFSSATLGDRANFSAATLGDGADFSHTRLGDGADFSHARLGEGANFFRATLGDRASFLGATLGDGANFSHATLKGQASWRRAVFRGVSGFLDVTWNAGTHYGGAFDSARFEDVANFKTVNFSAFAALYDATFKQRLLLQPPSDGQRPDDMFKLARKAAKDQAKTARDKIKLEDQEGWWLLKIWRFVKKRRGAKRNVWSELSGGYRTAKKAMEDAGDFDREQTFYRFEIKARLKRPGINMGERLAAVFYGVFSDYGASVARPFVWLFSLMVGFAGVYLGMAAHFTERPIASPFNTEAPYHRLGESAEPIWEALELSMNNAFRPLSALSTDEPREDRSTGSCSDCSISDALLFHEAGWVRFTVKALAILQSLLSFVLAFLVALSVRRKFQIN